MFQIGKKEIELLYLTASSKGGFSYQELIERFGYTERSFKYAVDLINRFLKENSQQAYLSIDNRRCCLEHGPLPMDYTLGKIKKEFYYLSREDRNETILFRYLANLSYTIEEMGDYLDVSKSTVKQSLAVVKDRCREYGLELASHAGMGMVLNGSETVIRTVLRQLLYKYSGLSEEERQYRKLALRNCNPYLREWILQFFQQSEAEQKAEQLFSCIKDFLPAIQNDEIYILAMLNLIIVFNRTGNGFYVPADMSDYVGQEGRRLAEKISRSCEEHLKISLPKEEFFEFVIGLNKGYSIESNEKNQYTLMGSMIWIHRLVSDLLQKHTNTPFQELKDNHQLDDALDMLYNHFYGAVERVTRNIYLQNPILDEIKDQYGQMFQEVQNSVKGLENYLEKSFSEGDIGYFTLLIENILSQLSKQSKKVRRIVLICGMGYGTSQIVKSKIIQKFDVIIEDVIPYYKLNHYADNKNIDLFVSTVPVNISTINNVVEVSPLITNLDIEVLSKAGMVRYGIDITSVMKLIEENAVITDYSKLEDSLKELYGINEMEHSKYDVLLKYLCESRILVNQTYETWQEAVRGAGNLLVKTGCVKTSYVDDMINNIKEFGSYITIGNGIALPHARNKNNVEKTAFSLVTLTEPVIFDNGKEIDTIISFCNVASNDYTKALTALMELSQNQSFLEFKKGVKTSKQLFDYIKNIK
jgi:transcriptional antiterminator/mannitol/fructose-specific phosphotransferase system IIA component (Ntr-type)